MVTDRDWVLDDGGPQGENDMIRDGEIRYTSRKRARSDMQA